MTLTGTPFWVSPEICRGESYTSKTDIWSFGCVIYYLATLRRPFDAKNALELFQMIMKGKYVPATEISNSLQHLIKSCLTVNQSYRKSAK